MSSSTRALSKRCLATALLDQKRGGTSDEKLSRPDSKAGRLQRECLALYHQHLSDRAIPTSGRFMFYELVDRGVVSKTYRRADGTPFSAVSAYNSLHQPRRRMGAESPAGDSAPATPIASRRGPWLQRPPAP